MKRLILGLAACLLLLNTTGPTNAGVISSGLVEWLKADAGITTDGSGNVSSWADQSGKGHNAAQSDQTLRPAFISNGLNGNPVLRFDGVGDLLSISGQVLTSQQFTIMTVVNDVTTPSSSNTGFREVFSNWDWTNSGNSVFLGTTGVSPARARFTDFMGGDLDPHGHVQQGVGTITDPSTHFILTGLSDTADATIYQNGNLIADQGAPLPPRNLTTGYVIGQQGSLGRDEYWNGDIAEILVYDKALSSAELQTNYNYLNEKYFGGSATPVPSTLVMSSILLGLCGAIWSCKRLKQSRWAS